MRLIPCMARNATSNPTGIASTDHDANHLQHYNIIIIWMHRKILDYCVDRNRIDVENDPALLRNNYTLLTVRKRTCRKST